MACRAVLAATAVGLTLPTAAAAQVTYAGSVRGATGTYLFTERTTSVVVVSAVEAERGAVRVSASVPVIHQSTPWVSYAAVPIPTGGRQSAAVGDQIRQGSGGGSSTDQGGQSGQGGSAGQVGPGGARSLTAATVPDGFVVVLPTETVTSQTGVGDPVFRGSYRLTSAYASTSVRLQAAWKPGLASATSGFGTGATDVAGGVTLVHVSGRQQLSGSAEYWRIGDMPGLVLNNAVAYRAGYDRYLPGNRWWMSGSVGGWTRIVEGIPPPADLSIGIGRTTAAGRSLAVTTSFGLTETAPDVMVALDWRVKL